MQNKAVITKPLRVGILPGESPEAMRALNEPLRRHLAQALGRKVELLVGRNYAATGEALRQQQVDLAYLGPVAYILQSRGRPLEPFARPTHAGATGPTFQAAFIVPAPSPVEDLSALRGQDLAFGDLVSTSGNWVPRYMLLGAGLVADRDYVRQHLGSHDAVAQAVVQRKVAAGCMSLSVLERLRAQGQVPEGSVRVLATSPAIPEYMWTFREGLDTALREALRAAFMQLRDPQALAAYRACAFIPAVDSDVDRVRHWMESILQARLHESGNPWIANASAITWPGPASTARDATPSHQAQALP